MYNYLFDHHPHLLGALVEGVVEENGDMLMLVHQVDKVLAGHICNANKWKIHELSVYQLLLTQIKEKNTISKARPLGNENSNTKPIGNQIHAYHQ